MKVESIRTLNGPNVYSYRPVLLMSLDLGELVERESREFNGFNERLLTLLPGINNHHRDATIRQEISLLHAAGITCIDIRA